MVFSVNANCTSVSFAGKLDQPPKSGGAGKAVSAMNMFKMMDKKGAVDTPGTAVETKHKNAVTQVSCPRNELLRIYAVACSNTKQRPALGELRLLWSEEILRRYTSCTAALAVELISQNASDFVPELRGGPVADPRHSVTHVFSVSAHRLKRVVLNRGPLLPELSRGSESWKV